jgi:hypothetical protein
MVAAAGFRENVHECTLPAAISTDDSNFLLSGQNVRHVFELIDCATIVTASQAFNQ